MSAHDLFFIPQPKPRSNTRKVWNIKETVSALGPEICTNILFLGAILGCDTTSALHGIGKGQALKKIKMDAVFRKQPSVFSNKEASKTDILAAGEKALVCLYKGRSNESLHLLRYTRFCQKVASEKSNPKASLELVLPLVITASGYSTKFSSGKGLRYHRKTGDGDLPMADLYHNEQTYRQRMRLC